jgi:alkylation response protein AidB-like acyl-CoA dehydrogenase
MDFQYSEEQTLLADSVKRLIDDSYDFEARKKVIASASGMSEAVWKQMAEMGLLSLPFGEDEGGFAAGAMGMIPTMKAFGEGLLLEPYVQTVGLAGRLVERLGNAAQKKAILPGVMDGTVKLALAFSEAQSRYELADVQTTANAKGSGYVLNGQKIMVIHGPHADHFVVSARTSETSVNSKGISLFLVSAKAPGVSLKTERTVDNQRSADLLLNEVSVGPEALLGSVGEGFEALDEAIDFAGVLLSGEAVGAMESANAATLEYLKSRKQFGVAIGSFQALQHRMVDMTIITRQADSLSLLAANAVDQFARGEISARERRHTVSATRIKIADACRLVGQEAIQLHGGMGMTQEMKVSHTFKRLTMISQAFGDADHFLERFAANDH